jgi:C_GCAxxG_C_C family probable redox protein
MKIISKDENIPEIAKKTMIEKNGNCAQAVFATYVEQMGLGNIDHETCLKIASAFGGGITQTGNVCGALTGAIMAIGLKYGGIRREDQVKANEVAGILLNKFKSLNGSIICRELINHDLISDEDVKLAFENDSFNNCAKFVEDASTILEKLL